MYSIPTKSCPSITLPIDPAIWYEFADLGEGEDYEGIFQAEYMATRADEPFDLSAWVATL